MKTIRTDEEIVLDLEWRLREQYQDVIFLEAVIDVLHILDKVDDDAYNYAISKIWYGNNRSQMIPVKQLAMVGINQVIVVVNDDLKASPNHTRFVIAHEIAHAYLNHPFKRKSKKKNQETEADNLAEKWGFKKD